MVSAREVEQQLDKLGFKVHGWGKGEVKELQHILVPDEEIYECVNGIYEGGFALLVATDIRVLLIDRKPLNFLTVEDLRFDMINEIDYSHRLMGAQISIATGSRNLRFRSYNQPRLRKLINHVQHCMAEAKKKQSTHAEGQNQHLEDIKDQLQTYLMAQQQYQQQLHQVEMARQQGQQVPLPPQPARPPNPVADILFAQSLMAEYNSQQANPASQAPPPAPAKIAKPTTYQSLQQNQLDEMYADGLREVFGRQLNTTPTTPAAAQPQPADQPQPPAKPLEVNSLKVAYSKLPMALRNRNFGRPKLIRHIPKTEPNAALTES